ncbi:hypothetical protein BBJ28_00009736 [Nothophytophthora sp. Chile5]|nr:hypothetical protein BBJ28_00009736 [Nothophytophthora sp. Chile5]
MSPGLLGVTSFPPDATAAATGRRNNGNNIKLGKLPAIITAAKAKRVSKRTEGRDECIAREETRQLEKNRRREREAEKIRHAQQRARARIAMANQLEQEEALHELQQQNCDSLDAAEHYAEKMRAAKESRLQAEERIRMKRQVKPPARPLEATISSKANPAVVKKATPERNEDVDADQKAMERKLRHETANRLRRMEQLEAKQRRPLSRLAVDEKSARRQIPLLIPHCCRSLTRYHSVPVGNASDYHILLKNPQTPTALKKQGIGNLLKRMLGKVGERIRLIITSFEGD